MKKKVFSGLIVAISVAVFFCLVNHWGTMGALFSSLILAGLIEHTTERTTEPNE